MDATLVLCDFAEAVGGKLYISGAGWTNIVAQAPAPVALGVIVQVPWDQTNSQHQLIIRLVDQDGNQVSLERAPNELVPVMQQGKFELGRPPGIPHGSALSMTLAIRWPTLPLPEGSYAFVLEINDSEVARASFRAVPNLPHKVMR